MYSQTGGREYRFWARYFLSLTRWSYWPESKRLASCIQRVTSEWPNVVFYELPAKLGPLDYLSLGYLLRRRVAEVGIAGSACILRVPGLVGSFLRQGYSKATILMGLKSSAIPMMSLPPSATTSDEACGPVFVHSMDADAVRKSSSSRVRNARCFAAALPAQTWRLPLILLKCRPARTSFCTPAESLSESSAGDAPHIGRHDGSNV